MCDACVFMFSMCQFVRVCVCVFFYMSLWVCVGGDVKVYSRTKVLDTDILGAGDNEKAQKGHTKVEILISGHFTCF